MKLSDSTLAILFTRGISFSVWEKIGILDREIKIYQDLSKEFKSIVFFSYGIDETKKYSRHFPSNVSIISRPKRIPKILYSIFLPFLHKSIWGKVSIVKTNQMDGSYTAVIVKKLYGAKLVLRMGYEWLDYLRKEKRPLFKRLIAWCVEYFSYKNADTVIISSEEGKKFIKETFNTEPKKINVIPNYVDTTRFAPRSDLKDPRQIVFVGRLEKVKNLNNLIDALIGLGVKLILVGEGSQKEQLKERAYSKGVEVEFLDIVPQVELPAVLNQSSIFMLPSLSEGNPKALLEAMSCGLACIGSKVSGISSIIQNGQNGLLCEIDVKSIHQTIVSLIGDSNMIQSLGENARKTICDKFSFDQIKQKEVAIYKSLNYDKYI